MSQTTDDNHHFIIKSEAEITNLTSLSPLAKEISEEGTTQEAKEVDIKSANKSISLMKLFIQFAVFAVVIGGITIVTKHFQTS